MNTREKLLKSLHKNPKTISELSKELKLARNAITIQIDHLVADGSVIKGERRKNTGAGKPAQVYKITPRTEDRGSTAYLPFVKSLMENLPNHMERKHRKALLQKVGKDMASAVAVNKQSSFDQRLQTAVTTVNELGASAEIIESKDEVMVKNITCPLASAVRAEPCVCDAVAAFFEEVTGAKTKANCQIGDQLICKYVIKK